MDACESADDLDLVLRGAAGLPERHARSPALPGHRADLAAGLMLVNVVTAVVDLIEADSVAEAMATHQQSLRRQGHAIYPDGCDAFVSEPTGQRRPPPELDRHWKEPP